MNQTSNVTTREGTQAMDGPFIPSVPGRLAMATGGLSLFGIGVLALLGPGPHVALIVGTIPLACISLAIFAVGLSVLRDDWEPTLALLLSFPFLAGIGLAGLLSAPTAGGPVGVVLAVAGALVICASARGHDVELPRVIVDASKRAEAGTGVGSNPMSA